MTNKGFFIKAIIAKGDGMITSRVDFKEGCNLLFGPSEMGKSSVFSLIEYLLGGRETPKQPPEGEGYTAFYMEYETIEDHQTHTVKRVHDEKTIQIKDCAYEQYETPSLKATSYKEKEYSQYLMTINGFDDNLKLRKSTTDKASFTYAWIRHLILADENRIVSELPIFNPQGQNTATTQEKSVIYYLTTGQDDSSFQEQEKKEHRDTRYEAMIALTHEDIEAVNKRIRDLGDVSYADFKDESILKAMEAKIAEEEGRLNERYNQRTKLENDRREVTSKLLFVREFIKRMEMLRKHYQTDIERYAFLFESANLFSLLTDTHECPVCHSEIKDMTQVDETYMETLQKEYEQVQSKINDIADLIEKKEKEKGRLIAQGNKIGLEINSAESEINSFTLKLSSIKSTLEKYQENIEKKAEARFLAEESQRLYKKLDKLEKEKKTKLATPEYHRQTSIGEEFCNMVKEKLVYWNILDEKDAVVFDESGFDFVLGGKARLTCGKGARGVTCSAILMTLLEYCDIKDIPFSHMMVLDSPITAHFTDKKRYAGETTQARFFQYCNEKVKDYQLIIIDNKSPEALERENLSNINYIEFSEEARNGFYLGKVEDTTV